MDVATLKHAYGPWGHSDRWVYQPPFGDYVYRAMSGFGQEAGGNGFATPFVFGLLIGGILGSSVERGARHRLSRQGAR